MSLDFILERSDPSPVSKGRSLCCDFFVSHRPSWVRNMGFVRFLPKLSPLNLNGSLTIWQTTKKEICWKNGLYATTTRYLPFMCYNLSALEFQVTLVKIVDKDSLRLNSGRKSLHSYRKLSDEKLGDCLAIKTEKIFASTSCLVISFIAICLTSRFIDPLVIRIQRFFQRLSFILDWGLPWWHQDKLRLMDHWLPCPLA